MVKQESKTKLCTNGLQSKDILYLQKKYSISEIESAIVDIYLRKKGLGSLKNRILIETIKKCDAKKEIEKYLLSKAIELDLKNIEKIFELLIEPSERKLNGAYYTPSFLAEYITEKAINGDAKVCDPACGSGAFLVCAVRRLRKITNRPIVKIIEDNIFGYDVLDSSIRRCKIILSILAVENGEDKAQIDFNLYCVDSLGFDWKRNHTKIFDKGGFDAVIGNPPYVRSKNLPENVRKNIQGNWETGGCGNVDLFIPFVELGINLVNNKGLVGYVLPNGYINSFSGINLRAWLQKNSYVKEIIDFNHLQLFQDATTYTCISLFDKKPKDNFKYVLINDLKNKPLDKLQFHRIEFKKLNARGWRLLPSNDWENIRKIETVGQQLEKVAKIKTGIATLRNYLYVLVNPQRNGKFFLKNHNGKEYKIEKDITRECIHAGTAKTTEQIDSEQRRIIFPYKRINGKYTVIPEGEVKKKYPQCYNYFLAVKDDLQKRDKGKKKYETWYAYGRTQGLETFSGRKIVVPTISNKPRFVISNKNNALIYAGYGIYFDGNLDVLAKLLNSKVMWYYITKTSKRYASGYMSFAKNFIKKFSIPDLSEKEKHLVKTNKVEIIDQFLIKKYGIKSCQ
jgi:type I restriction-modification system DNA methylase subunit